jgi:predicted DNA-binding transcriptional regulator AlpA
MSGRLYPHPSYLDRSVPPAEVAERIGVAKCTLRRWEKKGIFPKGRRSGRKVWWPLWVVLAWIEDNHSSTHS